MDPLVAITRSAGTPWRSAIHSRSGGYPTLVPYEKAPFGSACSAPAAASRRASAATMSSDGAPRAKEIGEAALTVR